ncbi:MAG: chromate efflux transporter [Candidatus Hydrogenedentota bacterium]|jgi:chromate transporter|uniref:Chromate transport protein n=1 Tax=Sumerlaea chitinivorans TaxID=2250252 RepID=A0A2Z4YAX4_SUMC1|nr:Chromate transport protein [Candidatus Sumerlaea chitinivorans]MCX7963263.1 chromate efflux transporter [Candidatus Sumerlaea chitinivorans]RMH24678.1 MAG: chromate efflux transporter [Candidatus Hydrogenedentota bacterium]GIX44668.1 MAG: chromate transporter [Candidatus Sumerlaea sp.]
MSGQTNIQEVEPEKGDTSSPLSLWQIAKLFAKIGTIGFGGGFAVIALMERECVERRRLLRPEEFIHGVALGQFLGSFAVNTAFFIGYRLRGLAGGLVAITSFLFPSVTLVILLSWIYFRMRTIPQLENLLAAAGPVVIALIVTAALSLGQKTLHSLPRWGIACVAFAVGLWRVSTLTILAVAALLGILLRLGQDASEAEDALPSESSPPQPIRLKTSHKDQQRLSANGVIPLAILGATSPSSLVTMGSLLTCLVVFLKIGFVFFGGGYLLVPLLHEYFVDGYRWLTEREFVDGLAISQLTPGPIAVLATFVGFHTAGAAGAVIATAALYMPATLLMALLSRSYALLNRYSAIRDVLGGVTPAVVGLVAESAVTLAPASGVSLSHPAGIAIAIAALILLLRKVPPALVIACGIGLGVLFPQLVQ